MRVMVYTDAVYRRHGDSVLGEIAFTEFVCGLADGCTEVTVLGRLDPGPGPAHYTLPEGVRFVALPHYRSLAEPMAVLRSLVASLRDAWRALKDVDAALLFGPYLHALLFALLSLARRRTVVLGVRQDFPAYVRSRRPQKRWMHVTANVLEVLWRLLARSLSVVVVGPGLASRYCRSRRLLVISASLISREDIDAGEQAARQRNYDGPELRLLSVGRLDEEKNPLLLTDILELLRAKDPRWRLTVCGEGPLLTALTAKLQAHGLEQFVELRGYVPLHEGLLELYRSSHVFLHVSLTEGLPQVLSEAFASGVPVVATAVGGVPQAVAGAAVLVEPSDARAAASAVRLLGSDSGLRASLLEAGLERALAATHEAEVSRVREFIAETVRGARRSSA